MNTLHNRRFSRAVFVIVALLLMAGGTVRAQTTYAWNVNTGGVWTTSNPERWLPVGTPAAGDHIVIGDVAGQTAGYAVTIEGLQSLSFGNVTIGGGAGNNGYIKRLQHKSGTDNRILVVAGGVIHSDGELIFDFRSTWRIGNGNAVTNFGLVSGGTSINPTLATGFRSQQSSGLSHFVNRGGIDIDFFGTGLPRELAFIDIRLDNVGNAFAVRTNETLYLQRMQVVGGSITNNGKIFRTWGSNVGSRTLGTATDPVRLVNKAEGVIEMRPAKGDCYDLYNAGTIRFTDAGGTSGATYHPGLIIQEGHRIESDGGWLESQSTQSVVLVNGVLQLDNAAQFTVQLVDLEIGAKGLLIGSGGTIRLAKGNLVIGATNNLAFDAAAIDVVFAGGVQTLACASADQGRDPAAFSNNFTFGTLTCAGTGSLTLTGGSGESLYVTELVLDGGKTLDIGARNVYVADAITVSGVRDNRRLVYGNGAFGGLISATTGKVYLYGKPAGTTITFK